MKAADQLQAEIERLIPKAESGEQWGEICRLEALMVAQLCKELGVPAELLQPMEAGNP